MGEHSSSPRPRIVIPARFSEGATALRYAAEVTSRKLVEAVWAAGGEPLVMHPSAPGAIVDDADVLGRLAVADGVLLPGGGDLSSRWTGQEHHDTLYDVDEEQDAFDLALARVCLTTGLPLLAVCRGLQVVNALRGGRIVQDMDEELGEERHHRHRVHDVSVASGSTLHGIVGQGVRASCYHHQCIASTGEGLRPVAWSEDGVVEAVETDGPGWFVGVQWHPEDTWETESQQRALFVALVQASAGRLSSVEL
ncbi:gamma-glutamyl-gamma-aminobutyrate hydrolase family protein [Aeromicrobium fastidiosum]|uniref:Gamma-glutamyl-gamma-aminobutyrate hydrolase family protein n=1 Tax=Aeromicrobium fastidiosum TaxID=52699 RepID=A0A641AUA1_9ACTN|nr:gamma-glutamyl-gamma-aminobutyrate hydrolase family protein [Aeromicrobium fastidiosum]KAA1380591.1 gamma-glutamyl-gamma-aminobutyrate hydrolase family protein [Aeromicrobium fastidiosum]MBP2390190.1 putative glutamine amidotransferase [Aeromicrobium fastidiosum]